MIEMSRKNLENRENFSFLKGNRMRYLDVSKDLLRKEKPSQKRLK